MRQFPVSVRFVFSFLALATTLFALAPRPVVVSRPNIVFILADDLGYGELGSYGQTMIQTPALDRMAAEGMRFTQFYAGSPVCAPSRSVLMTGQHTGHTRVRGNSRRNLAAQSLRNDDESLARVLRSAGYATGLVGKWGLGFSAEMGEPRALGFDYFFGFLNQTHAHNHHPDFLWRNGGKVTLANDLVATRADDGSAIEGVGYATKRVAYAGDLFAADAAEFIERHQAQPFFLFLSIVAPHANNERMRALGEGHEAPDLGPYADKPWHETYKLHAAMITRFDRQIGELLAQLKRLGLDEKTLVLFSSDNGPHNEAGPNYDPKFFRTAGPFTGIKRSLTEGGIRVPFLARWPGRIKAGTVSGHVGYFGDLMATFGELAGAALPPERDSVSLVPTLLGRGSQRRHEHLYWEFYEGGVSQAVLLGSRWKALRAQRTAAPIKLYDLENDVAEQTDVAAQHPDLVARVGEIMRTAHVDNEHWKIPPGQ